MNPLERHHVNLSGSGTQPMLFAHGFGCDQNMWRLITPAFEEGYRIVLYDLMGAGRSDLSAYDRDRYATLDGHADDLLEICAALDLQDIIFVGHSVSSMIGVIAAIREPERFARIIQVGPSPCYINKGDYVGGFERQDIEELLDFMDSNYLGWAKTLAPTIMGPNQPEELKEELANSFCATDPDIARHFGRVTFLSDNRDDLPKLKTPSLLLQSTEDVIAPLSVGEYMHRVLPDSELVVIPNSGHCVHLSAPKATIAAIQNYLHR